MKEPELFIPFFCNHCHQLAFIAKNSEGGIRAVLEFNKSSWKQHLCYNIKGESIWNHNPELPKIAWGQRKLPLNFPERQKKTHQNDFSFGIIMELPDEKTEDQRNLFIKVLTVENSIIYIRTVQQSTISSAGLLFDLSKAKKVGNDKYRIPEIIPVSALVNLERQKEETHNYFSFALSANDQEQLESFVDRFLKTLSKNNLYVHSIIPLQNSHLEEAMVFKRKLSIGSAYKLQKIIETIAFPESIKISIS